MQWPSEAETALKGKRFFAYPLKFFVDKPIRSAGNEHLTRGNCCQRGEVHLDPVLNKELP